MQAARASVIGNTAWEVEVLRFMLRTYLQRDHGGEIWGRSYCLSLIRASCRMCCCKL